VYQMPEQLTDLETQAAAGAIHLLASTGSDNTPWHYRLYAIDQDSPSADPGELSHYLVVRIDSTGGVQQVASPRELIHREWAEDLVDRLWDGLEDGTLPASITDAMQEQAIAAEITSGPAPAPAPDRPLSTPSAEGPQYQWTETQGRSDGLVPGVVVQHLSDGPEFDPDPDDLTEAVVYRRPDEAAGDILVQDVDADDGPYSVSIDSIVLRREEPAPGPAPAATRFQPNGQQDLAPSGRMARVRANIAAIRVLHLLRDEERPATAAEQAVLARWSSWGAVPQVFDPRVRDFANLRAELRGLLTETQWNAAEATTRNAHFTDAGLVQPIWQALADMGFVGGRVLEPGSGSSNFIAYAPGNAQMTGIELDPVTAEIAAALYPDAEVRNEDFVATRYPEGYFDLSVGNVPFDEIALHDPKFNPLRLNTHNHFIIKSLELTRPGGLVAVLTSRYTMDSTGRTARLEIAERADLVGAVRLPAGAHWQAAGTKAVTDLLILRRRDGNPPKTPPEWVGLSSVQVDTEHSILVNSYFAQHPDMVLGIHGLTSNQFTDKDITVRAREGVDLGEALTTALTEVTRQARESGLTMSASPDAKQRAAVDQRVERMRRAEELFGDDLQRFEGTLLDQSDGTFLQIAGGEVATRVVFRNAAAELSSLLKLRDTYVDLLSAESTQDDEQATSLRALLNLHYDAHVAAYGHLNLQTRRDHRSAHGAFRTDPYAAGVYALEILDRDTGTAKKSDIFTKTVTRIQPDQSTAETAEDALAISLNTYHEVRLGEIAELLDLESLDEARKALGELVYNEPGTQKLIPAANYLSGDVRTKLEQVEAILRMVSPESRSQHPFQANAEALRRTLPPDKQPGDIEDIQFGATWIAPQYYQDFLRQLLQSRYVDVKLTGGADWEVSAPPAVRKGRAATKVYGTDKRNAIELAQRMLRRNTLVVKPPKLDEDATPEEIADGKRWAADQTEQTVAKADELQRLFGDWLWQDSDRATTVLAAYNRLHNSFVPYQGDGAYLRFPGISDRITPRPHQRAGVARVLAQPEGSFLDYEVGFGKTLTIAMTVMEMRRLGLVNKPCIVVKNPTVNGFRNDFMEAYPHARVLAIDAADFTSDTAAAYIAQIANGDWDAVILPQSLFKRIPVSGRGQQQFVADQTAEYRARIHKALTGNDDALASELNPGGDPLIADALATAVAASGIDPRGAIPASRETVKKLQGDLKRHTQRVEKNLVKTATTGISWEQTGIDGIIVDEVQDFANAEVGANNSELSLPVSGQSRDLIVKLRSPGNRVAIGSTGTPFPNAMPQAFVMLNYFRPDLLQKAGLEAFSSFQAQFLTDVVAPEISPEGIPRIKERIGAFRNARQFSYLWKTMADVKTKHDIQLPIPEQDTRTVVVPATDNDRMFMADIAARAEAVRAGDVDPSTDNLLWISNDGRQAALDLRMAGYDADGIGKLDAAAERIAAIYHEHKHRKYNDRDGNPTRRDGASQFVFADRGTPSDKSIKEGRFIAYHYLRDRLIEYGVPEDLIKFSQDAKTAEEKEHLFSEKRTGGVAVLMGSTDSMGVGVNGQDRAIALHHLDVPWRPSDVTQREGRIVRQFNQHYKLGIPVQIYRWVKEGSFDSFMWQTVERKARFIDQIRTGRDLDEQSQKLDGDLGKDYLEFGEIKAIATGNPLLLKQLAADEEVRQLEAAFKSWRRTDQHLRNVVDSADETLAKATGYADIVHKAVQRLPSDKSDSDTFRMETPEGKAITKRQDAAAELRTRLSLMHRRMRGDVSQYEHVATLDGQMIMARINTFQDFITFTVRGLADVPGASFVVDDIDALVSSGKPSMGLVTRMENYVAKLPGLHTTLLNVVEELKQEIERAQKLVGKPFGKMDKLRRARAEQAQLLVDIEEQAGRTPSEGDEAGQTAASSADNLSNVEVNAQAQASGGRSSSGSTPPVEPQPERNAAPPYADRAAYWAGEHAAVGAYRAWASKFGSQLDSGTAAERGLALAAEWMLTESADARQSRLLGLEHLVDPQLATEFANRARAVAEQWDREQRGPEQVGSTWGMVTAVRDHAAQYRSTVRDQQSEVFQQWDATDEPVTLGDEEAAQAIPGLSPISEYTVTGPGGVQTDPVTGIDLAAGIGQLIADGATVEETATGLVVSVPGGARFDIRAAHADDDLADGPSSQDDFQAEVALEPSVDVAQELEQQAPGSAIARVHWAAILFGRYSDAGELVAGRELVSATVDKLREALEGEPDPFSTPLLDELTAAHSAVQGVQVSPPDVFLAYDRLAVVAADIAEDSRGEVRAHAEKLQQRTERHLARMQAHGRDLFDVLLEAAALDPDSWAVLVRTDPAKESPNPYSDSSHLHLSRQILFEAYDRWPEVAGGGGDASHQLRGAMWERRQAPDTRIGAVLTDWMQVVSHALAAAEESTADSRRALHDFAQRAYQHHQSLAAYQLAADQAAPYVEADDFTAGAERVAGAWESWLASATAHDLADRDGGQPQDAPFVPARAALEEIREALYAADSAYDSDGRLDSLTRHTTRLAHAAYALALSLREGDFRRPDDQAVLLNLVRTAYEHAAACHASTQRPDTTAQVRQGLAERKTQLRDEAIDSDAVPVPDDAATVDAVVLEIEHNHRGTLVRGTTNEAADAAVRGALNRHKFKFQGNEGYWYLPRTMARTSRNEHVRNLVDALSRLGRSHQLTEGTPPEQAPVEVAIPAGEPYTSKQEAESDFQEMFGAYWRLKDTPAGSRLTMPGVDGRPDGEAVHDALKAMRQGPVGSSLDPFAHAGEDVVARCIELARATQTLSHNLAEERYRAPVALPHLRTMTQYATLLASRITATSEQNLWEPLFSTPAHPGQPTPAADADVVAPAAGAAADPVVPVEVEAASEPGPTGLPPQSQAAATATGDPLVAGPYTREGLWEAIERLGSLRNEVVQSGPVATLEAVNADAVGVYTGRWSAANQAGYAAHRGESTHADAAEAYRRALGATNALIRELERGYLPPDVRALVGRLVTATEHHLTRLSLTHHIAEEAAAAEQVQREQEREAQQVGSTEDHADEELAAARQAKRAEVEASIAVSLAATHMRARQWAVRAALSADIVRQWFQEGTQEEMRPRFREWLRALSIPDPESAASDRFSDWFVASGPEAEEIVAEEVFGDVYASLAVLADAPSAEDAILVEAAPAVANDPGMADETGSRASEQ